MEAGKDDGRQFTLLTGGPNEHDFRLLFRWRI